MNIYTVRDNLKKTIEGKEAYSEVLYEKAGYAVFPENTVYRGMAEMLDVNIEELKRILADVEQCCIEHNEMSWQLNPERMGQ